MYICIYIYIYTCIYIYIYIYVYIHIGRERERDMHGYVLKISHVPAHSEICVLFYNKHNMYLLLIITMIITSACSSRASLAITRPP